MVATTAPRNKKAKRGPTPLEQTARSYSPPPAPSDSLFDDPLPIVFDLMTLPPEMLANREQFAAFASSRRFERWLRLHCASKGIPIDTAGTVIELLVIWVEWELIERVRRPHLYRVAIDEGEDDEFICDETDAAYHGLTIRPAPRQRTEPACIMPGCQGHLIDGVECVQLRRYGERFCPKHAAEYVKLMRAGCK